MAHDTIDTTLPSLFVVNRKASPHELLEETLYVFFLSDNIWAMLVGVFCAMIQVCVLISFAYHRSNDETYCAVQCSIASDGTFEFDGEEDKTTNYGRFFMFLVLWAFTWPDITLGLQLMAKWWYQTPTGERLHFKYIKLFVTGLVTFLIATCSLWIAGVYTWSTGLSDTDLLMNIVGILYIMDADEAAFKIVSGFDPVWQAMIFDNIQTDFAHMGEDNDDDSNNANNTLADGKEDPDSTNSK